MNIAWYTPGHCGGYTDFTASCGFGYIRINAGQNMGEDVLYSGTVAAALEASLFGYKAMAVS